MVCYQKTLNTTGFHNFKGLKIILRPLYFLNHVSSKQSHHFTNNCCIVIFALALHFLHIFYTASKILLPYLIGCWNPKRTKKISHSKWVSVLSLQESNPALEKHHVSPLDPSSCFVLGTTTVGTTYMVCWAGAPTVIDRQQACQWTYHEAEL